MRRGSPSRAGRALVAASLAACVAACNALSGVDDLNPCTFCELDGAPLLDAAGEDVTPPSDGSAAPDVQDAASPADATLVDARVDAPPDAGPPIGCQGATDCERVVFVSSAVYAGDLGGVVGADAKCQALADASSVPRIKGRSFLAWVSTAATSPSLRFTHGTMRYILGDGTPVAASWLDLTVGSLTNGIDTDEQDAVRMGGAWTATSSINATYSGQSCLDWTSTKLGDKGRYGNVGGSGNGWSGSGDSDCGALNALYCFEK
jgi:hypothetical protein